MRISDWSSDVCSSDLPAPRHPFDGRQKEGHDGEKGREEPGGQCPPPVPAEWLIGFLHEYSGHVGLRPYPRTHSRPEPSIPAWLAGPATDRATQSSRLAHRLEERSVSEACSQKSR